MAERNFIKDAQEWLGRCKFLCQERLPGEISSTIPPELWNHFVMGRNIIVRRFPPTSKIGKIQIPDVAQSPVDGGWVISVGFDVAVPAPNTPHAWPFDPLDLVGRPVVLHRARGITLRFSLVQREFMGIYIHNHIGDVLGVMTQISDDYWMPEKPSPILNP